MGDQFAGVDLHCHDNELAAVSKHIYLASQPSTHMQILRSLIIIIRPVNGSSWPSGLKSYSLASKLDRRDNFRHTREGHAEHKFNTN